MVTPRRRRNQVDRTDRALHRLRERRTRRVINLQVQLVRPTPRAIPHSPSPDLYSYSPIPDSPLNISYTPPPLPSAPYEQPPYESNSHEEPTLFTVNPAYHFLPDPTYYHPPAVLYYDPFRQRIDNQGNIIEIINEQGNFNEQGDIIELDDTIGVTDEEVIDIPFNEIRHLVPEAAQHNVDTFVAFINQQDNPVQLLEDFINNLQPPQDDPSIDQSMR